MAKIPKKEEKNINSEPDSGTQVQRSGRLREGWGRAGGVDDQTTLICYPSSDSQRQRPLWRPPGPPSIQTSPHQHRSTRDEATGGPAGVGVVVVGVRGCTGRVSSDGERF